MRNSSPDEQMHLERRLARSIMENLNSPVDAGLSSSPDPMDNIFELATRHTVVPFPIVMAQPLQGLRSYEATPRSKTRLHYTINAPYHLTIRDSSPL